MTVTLHHRECRKQYTPGISLDTEHCERCRYLAALIKRVKRLHCNHRSGSRR